jgi:predicted RecB family nuclease
MDSSIKNIQVTEKVLRAYFSCVRKSYLLMFFRELSIPTEYEVELNKRNLRVRANFLDGRTVQKLDMALFPRGNEPCEQDIFVAIPASTDLLSIEGAIYKAVPKKRCTEETRYEPIIFATTYTLRKEDKIEISFAGYVQSQIQGNNPLRGKVVLLDASENTVRLSEYIKYTIPAIDILMGWVISKPEPPPAILNKHCPYCEFQNICQPIAEEQDSISLLGGN